MRSFAPTLFLAIAAALLRSTVGQNQTGDLANVIIFPIKTRTASTLDRNSYRVRLRGALRQLTGWQDITDVEIIVPTGGTGTEVIAQIVLPQGASVARMLQVLTSMSRQTIAQILIAYPNDVFEVGVPTVRLVGPPSPPPPPLPPLAGKVFILEGGLVSTKAPPDNPGVLWGVIGFVATAALCALIVSGRKAIKANRLHAALHAAGLSSKEQSETNMPALPDKFSSVEPESPDSRSWR